MAHRERGHVSRGRREETRDLYVPVSTVESADDQIVLNVDEGQLESMGLPKPDLFS